MSKTLEQRLPGVMIVAAGMDCSGKGTIVKGLEEWANEANLKVFDLRAYEKEKGDFPDIQEVLEYDVILSAEPHYALAGAALRKRMIVNRTQTEIPQKSALDNEIARSISIQKISIDYTASATAQMFALDRLVAYTEITIPLLKAGKIIFQERHVESSLVYQPVQALLEGKTEDEESFREQCVMPLEGNILALRKYPANAIFVARCTVEEAMRRKLARIEKDDQCKFEREKFQTMLKERYESPWFKNIFSLYGTDVEYVDTSGQDVEKSKRNATWAWIGYLHRLSKEGRLPRILDK